MSKEYAEDCIREILKEVDGHAGKAQQRIIADAVTDHRLLLALTQGHLTGIVSLWVNRVITRIQREPEVVPEKPEMLDMDSSTFGKEILTAMQSGSSAEFSKEQAAPRIGRKQASQAHIDAIQQIAKSSKTPRKEE